MPPDDHVGQTTFSLHNEALKLFCSFVLSIPTAIFHETGTAHHAVFSKCSMPPSGSAAPI